MKEYASLILEKNGKYLVERRKMTKKLDPGDIVFPAGRIEAGETKEQAVVREMKEELDITIHGVELVYEAVFEGKRIYWFRCASFDGEIKKYEADELIWLTYEERDRFTYDVTRSALQAYRDSSSSHRSS